MNYQTIYNQLMLRGQDRVLTGYSEKHHIVPVCVGGTNDPSNIVCLTSHEHFVAHQLLVKIYRGTPYFGKLVMSARLLTTDKRNPNGTNKLHGWLKKAVSEASRQLKLGSKNSAETRAKIAASNTGKVKSQAQRDAISAGMKGVKGEPTSCLFCKKQITNRLLGCHQHFCKSVPSKSQT